MCAERVAKAKTSRKEQETGSGDVELGLRPSHTHSTKYNLPIMIIGSSMAHFCSLLNGFGLIVRRNQDAKAGREPTSVAVI